MSKNLFAILCKDSTLLNAWKNIKQKGAGGGIDGISIDDFEKELGSNLKQLQKELIEHKWEPEPYLKISIPKNEKEQRTLGMLCIKDKIVQQIIKQILEPKFEKEFVSNSYAYRPEKGHNKAIKFTRSCVQNKDFKYALRLDIDDFFDSINHDILFDLITPLITDEEILRLVKLCVKMGMVNKKLKWNEITAGVHQGSVLSPMLANYYLTQFDKFVLSKTKLYIRYADDFVIGCSTLEETSSLLGECTDFLKDSLKLRLNTPVITEIQQGVEFLGITITKKTLSLSTEKKNDLKERIASIDWAEKKFNDTGIQKLIGINNYYAHLLPQEILTELDEFLICHLHNIIKEKWRTIPNKSTLRSALRNILFFSDWYMLNKTKIHIDLVDQYTLLKTQAIRKEGESANKKVILKKKHEYRLKENESSELVINKFGTFIGLNNKGLALKVFGKKQDLPPLNNLHHITVISEGVSISSNALSYCLSRNIGIDFFTNTGKHIGSFLSMKYLNTSLWQKQNNLSVIDKSILAISLIKGKIKNQLNLIKYYHKYHKDKSATLSAIFDNVHPKIKEILTKTDNLEGNSKYAPTLLALEAQAAELYWSYIKDLIKDNHLEFTKREHKGATDIVNSLLNYGYSILYSRVWKSILSKELNPTESVLHSYQKGKPTLAYDIIEIFRTQAVDRVVISMILKKEHLQVTKGQLDDETKTLLIKNITERLNRYETYKGIECRLCDIIENQVKEIANFIRNGEKYKPYTAKW